MLATPNTAHVNFDRVYEPAEDSFLLLDVLSSSQETLFLRNRLVDADHVEPILAVEAGTGSGVVLAFLTAHAGHIFGQKHPVLTLGTDVNEYACVAAKQTVQSALQEELSKRTASAAFLDTVQGDLVSSLRDSSVDVLVFNPPYVPTEESPSSIQQGLQSETSKSAYERDSALLSLSYAGGPNGMETTHRLLKDLSRILTPYRGIAYILLCAQNKPIEVANLVRSWGNGWSASSAGERKAGWENLMVMRVWQQRTSL
jgi:release factor glutamine methyltransferase